MYESFFGFIEKPFNLTPDPKYLYLSARHTEAFAHLDFARRERGGFVVITGEVGTGKTTVARYFLSGLKDAATAVILYPALSAAELLGSILDDFRVAARGPSLKDLVDALHEFLLESRAKGKSVVVVIDEAQDLSAEVLEQVRLISNLETDTEKLIQIILMGQSELKDLLARRELRQLAQRVTARYHLAPLGRSETEAYVVHRIRVAGGEGKVAFAPGALAAIHAESGGVPRLINLICDRALLAGYVAGTRTIGVPAVRRAAAEVRGESGELGRRRPAVFAAAGLVAVLGAAWLLRREAPGPAAPPPPATSPVVVSTPPAPSQPRLDSIEPLLVSAERATSLERATREVQAEWGPGPLLATPLRAHLEQLRRLDLPAVLEMFHPSRRDTCFVSLLRLDSEAASIGDGRGGTRRVGLTELDRYWTRQATLSWRDAEGAAIADPRQAGHFARAALARLGYFQAGADFTAAVTRFQRETELTADGLVGQRTLMALYSRSEHPRPRLSGGTS